MKSSSIKILNPSNTWDVYTPKFLRVARPYTEEYARKKRNDWFFRCYYEYLDIKAKGGVTFWFTLTFNNENLPKLQINEYIDSVPFLSKTPHSSPWNDVPDTEVIPCFDSHLVSLFVKEMNIYLSRLGYDTKGLKFLVCAEYGSKTQRSHHHGIGFSPVPIPRDVILECLRRAWHYGFVGAGKKDFIVDSIYAIRYVTKYVCKDTSFDKCNKFPSGKTLGYYLAHQDAYSVAELRKLLRPRLPQMISSKGIGECYMKYLSSLTERERLDMCTFKKKVTLPIGRGLGMEFQLPQYYINKLCYYVHKDLSKIYGRTISLVSDFGRTCLRAKISTRIANVEKRIREIDFNVCSGLHLLQDFYRVHSVDSQFLAWYLGFFRYLVPNRNGILDYSVTPSYMFSNREFLLSEFMQDKVNVYVSDYLFASGEIDREWLHEHSGGSLFSRPLFMDNGTHPALHSSVCADLQAFKKYEIAAQSFDHLMDVVFEQNELRKRDKRIKQEADKYDCLKSNPNLIKSYESFKDSDIFNVSAPSIS